MTKHPSLDTALASLAAETSASHTDGFMDGVWQRAGQLGEIADRRRRAAVFSGLFVVGLGSGISTTVLPNSLAPNSQVAAYDFDVSRTLSPTALLEGGH